MKEWYKLIDEGVRAENKFLIPVDVIRNLDLSEPIYIEEIGGFYIIEEIAEYVNSSNLVTIKIPTTPNNVIMTQSHATFLLRRY